MKARDKAFQEIFDLVTDEAEAAERRADHSHALGHHTREKREREEASAYRALLVKLYRRKSSPLT